MEQHFGCFSHISLYGWRLHIILNFSKWFASATKTCMALSSVIVWGKQHEKISNILFTLVSTWSLSSKLPISIHCALRSPPQLRKQRFRIHILTVYGQKKYSIWKKCTNAWKKYDQKHRRWFVFLRMIHKLLVFVSRSLALFVSVCGHIGMGSTILIIIMMIEEKYTNNNNNRPRQHPRITKHFARTSTVSLFFSELLVLLLLLMLLLLLLSSFLLGLL